MTAKEIVYHIKTLKAGGLQSQNQAISDMEYLSMVDDYRATIIRQQLAAGQRLNDRIIQDLVFVKIKNSDNFNKMITELELPTPIETHNADLIVSVTNDDGHIYSKNYHTAIVWTDYSRFTREAPKWYWVGNKMGVVNHVGNKNHLRISGVFEHPYKVVVFNEKDNPLDPLDFEYPMSITMRDMVFKMIADSELKFTMNQMQDTRNNSADENQSRQNS